MRVSYTLLRHFEDCEFRSKLTDFDRVRYPPIDLERVPNWVKGVLRHEAQAAILRGQPDVGMDLVTRQAERLLPHAGDSLRKLLVYDAAAAAGRWATFWRPDRFMAERRLEGNRRVPLIEHKLVVKLPTPVGIFTELAFIPDFVGIERKSGHTWLWDWKWQTGALDTDESLRYDKQSMLSQYGLSLMGIDVKGHGRVHGRLETPSVPKVTKAGGVSRQPVLCSWADYQAVLVANGLDVAEYAGMEAKLTPFFKEHVNYRSAKEVKAQWYDTITPLLLRITDAVEHTGFVRRMRDDICPTCPFNEECISGLFGTATNPAFNTRFGFDGPARKQAEEVEF